MTSSHSVRCPKCAGTGRAQLTEVLSRTLQAVEAVATRSANDDATSQEVHAWLASHGYRVGCTATLNNLAKLTKIGAVKRAGRVGRFWTYRKGDL